MYIFFSRTGSRHLDDLLGVAIVYPKVEFLYSATSRFVDKLEQCLDMHVDMIKRENILDLSSGHDKDNCSLQCII
jgi:hypothetical protein